MNDITSPIIIGLLLVGGILVDEVAAVLGFVAVVSALMTAAFRALAVLRKRSAKEIERATSIGFVVGVATTATIFLAEWIIGLIA